jgi:predicted transcriptional regulator
MDAVQDKLDELARVVEQARAMPMSSSVMVHRGEVLDLLEELRALLPVALRQAQDLLDRREEVLAQGRQDAEQLRAQARAERGRLVEETAVHRQASAEAAQLLEAAREQAETMQVQVDDYVDGKLANFEIVLHKTLSAVERGRAKLAGRSALDELSSGDDDGPLPQ